jgi:leader peptidase (prepilin peptidase)/N-methyltransferase
MALVDALVLAMFFVLGATIGSFSNVLIHRIPRGESIAYPPSRCPRCGHRLGVLDLVPILSWLGLRGRCRHCGAPISARYPLVELASGLGYLAIAWRFPPLELGLATLGLCFAFTILLVSSAIDLETKTLPDALTLPAVGVGLALALLPSSAPALPDFGGALHGALLGAGLLSLIGAYGSWALRRFREPRFPEYPLGYQQIHVSALAGAVAGGLLGGQWAGPAWGVAAGLASAFLNLALRRVVRVPDGLTLGGLLLAVVLSSLGSGLVSAVQGALLGAGGTALLAGLYWAFRPEPDDPEADGDPVAMGFGDVKLAAAIGAFLAWQGLVVGLFVAVVLGALIGVVSRLMGGEREIPFGPFLAAGAVVALFAGPGLLEAYLRAAGL